MPRRQPRSEEIGKADGGGCSLDGLCLVWCALALYLLAREDDLLRAGSASLCPPHAHTPLVLPIHAGTTAGLPIVGKKVTIAEVGLHVYESTELSLRFR